MSLRKCYKWCVSLTFTEKYKSKNKSLIPYQNKPDRKMHFAINNTISHANMNICWQEPVCSVYIAVHLEKLIREKLKINLWYTNTKWPIPVGMPRNALGFLLSGLCLLNSYLCSHPPPWKLFIIYECKN